MAFTNSTSNAGPMSDMNVTPLVDVMLVLLIIFMITAPIMAHRIEIDLPQPTTAPPPPIDPPDPVKLVIKETGDLFWNDQPMIRQALEPQLRIEASKDPQPEIRIDAEPRTHYETVAEVLATAKNVGITKLAFENMPSGF
ncbi:MAG TPA: biopolymer transporter ExbD [Candidatus Saccharimonadia bacterium]|nr:biopolymer transporter ExbD [Candidatus Saccharimonadia bacterium]